MDEGCGGDREWARDGPETDALKDAKLALAEVLGEVDEVRLLCRRELHALQEAVAVADGENAKLRRSEEEFVPEKSLFSSVKLLFNIARGHVRCQPLPLHVALLLTYLYLVA
ncbi:unnamed protein product [Prorocentrum cordatum]|uniref:Uncharacterized protein n=1 Tax=Prorocentrum cordatum TaxID=2364126 RepID=A0ABN9WJH4_9DINO|nr:unnamed protein product [Polarella glacialis]